MPVTTDKTAIGSIPSPQEQFGFRVGTDRRLIRWDQLRTYFETLAARSDRLLCEEFGHDWSGRPLICLTVSSPDNLRKLSDYQSIQQRLFDARSLSEKDRAHYLDDGRCICLITCSIHPTEVGPTQFSPELVYDLITRNDDPILRILDQVILLIVPSLNPGGLELVADWYERTMGTPYEGSVPPRLYHPYAGHDNNRDWFMTTLPENRATVVQILNRWHPHIVFDLHQMQVNGPRFVLPPYIDPYDPNVHPLIQTQIDALGSAIAVDLAAEGKRGVATSVIFDAYSPSRAYAHYHGGVRMLAEAASVRIATPVDVPRDFLAETRGFDPHLASHTHPLPWDGGAWTLRNIIDYFRTATFSLLDHAARYRDRWVANFARVQQAAVAPSTPFAFLILPLSLQRDASTAMELVEVLIRGGIEVDQANAPFDADGVEFPAGTLIIRLAQPAGAFAKTLMELQHYPNLALFPGGPPKPPYDITSHSLPLQMGVDAVRIDTRFDAQATRLTEPPRLRGGLSGFVSSETFLIGPESNNVYRLINTLLGMGARVARSEQSLLIEHRRFPTGTFVVDGISAANISALAEQGGVVVGALSGAMPERRALHAPRVGVYQSWRSNAIDEGWTRFVLEGFAFPYVTIKDAEIKRGDLAERFDAIVLPQQSARDILDGNSLAEYPAEYAGGLGDIGASNLRRFVEAGGTLIALDAACDFAIRHLYLPVANALDGMRSETFSAPGSLLRILVDSDHPIGWGFEREAAAMFVSSPAFEVRGNAQTVAQYPLTNQLLSGWLQGAEHIAGRTAIVDVAVGLGRAILIGFRPQFRAQARGTYRLLFNSLYYSALARTTLR